MFRLSGVVNELRGRTSMTVPNSREWINRGKSFGKGQTSHWGLGHMGMVSLLT